MLLDLERVNAYELKENRRLKDIHSDAYYLTHKKSGARICVISNDDENKVFYIGFRTPPKDSTGVAHIIEHTVLCGSEKFPVKDPFIELAKGSLNTFLNAMTYPDKTVYPVASCNDKDFQNLMDVYMDSVLHPNIYKEEKIFKQEGWHYELHSPEDDLGINGVVYNEMKGAFSSSDDVLEREILNSLFPDTTYRNESGGDPDNIPELTYEAYLDFHRTYYHPSNSYIFLYGNMDVAEKLQWLDEEYLKDYSYLSVDSEIPLQKAFEEPKDVEKYYSIASSESEEDNSYLSCNWAVGKPLDRYQGVAFDLLEHALLNRSGAPIKQALLDAGIGDDIYGGYDGSVRQPYFSIIAKNTNKESEAEFLQIIRDVLTAQVKEGVSKKTLLAAINGAEFKYREADFGRFPKGLLFGLNLLDSWIYDENQPFAYTDESEIFEYMRNMLDTDYFENLIQEYMLDNTHCTHVRVLPMKGLNAQKEQQAQEERNAYKASLTQEQVEELIRQTEELEAYQEEPSSKEDLEKIPLLSREDLKKVTDPYSNVWDTTGVLPCLWHDYHTGGIVYLDWIFDMHHIPEEKLPYVSILKSLLGYMDTEEYSFRDLSDEINFYTGGIGCETNVHPVVDDRDEYSPKFELRMKTLEINLPKAVELAKSMLLHTLFTDEKRMYEVLAQKKSRAQAELSEAGHLVSVSRALSYYSKKSRVSDLLSNISSYRVLCDVVDHFEEKKEELVSILTSLMEQLFQEGNMLVNCTCEESGLEQVKQLLPEMKQGLYEDTDRTPVSVSLPDIKNEGFTDASQIQYVSVAGNYGKKGLDYTGALRVFKTIMNYDYLWNNVRVKGGAYGCGCMIGRSGDIAFYSYRDPNLGKTVDTFKGVTEYLKDFDADERDMTKFVIGTFSEMDTPLTPIAKGRRSLLGEFSGLTVEMMQEDRNQVLSCEPKDIRALSALTEAVMENHYLCAVGNEEKLLQEKELFEHLEALA